MKKNLTITIKVTAYLECKYMSYSLTYVLALAEDVNSITMSIKDWFHTVLQLWKQLTHRSIAFTPTT